MAKDKIRILQLAGAIAPGGVTTVIDNIIGCLPDDRYQFAICALQDKLTGVDFTRNIKQQGIPVYSCHQPTKLNPFNAIRTIVNLRKIIRDFQPDIIHSHLLSYTAPFQWLATKGYKCAHVFMVHGTGTIYTQPGWKAELARKCHRLSIRKLNPHVVTVSDAVSEMCRNVLRVSPEKIVRIYSGIDTNYLSPFEPEQKIKLKQQMFPGINNETPVVLSTSRLDPEKGVELLLDVWAHVQKAVPEARLILAGGGGLQEYFKEKIHRLGMDNSITMTGYVKDVKPLYAVSDVSILLSESEGLGMSLIEGLSMGHAAFASNISGVDEVVSPEVGVLVNLKQDTADIAKQLIELLRNSEDIRRKGNAGRDRAVKMFSRQSMRPQYVKLYEDLLDLQNAR